MHQRAYCFLLLLLLLFFKHCLAQKLVFTGGFGLVYDVLSVLIALCSTFSPHVQMTLNVHDTDLCLSSTL